jgi:hypothetical protein
MLVCPAFRKEFNQEQKRKEKEKRQRIINREKEERTVKRIHPKRPAILFSQIAPQFVYIAESASATNKQQSPLLEDSTYTMSYIRLKEHLTFCIFFCQRLSDPSLHHRKT